MISQNTVDITGFIYNINVNHGEKFGRLFFTVSVGNRYRNAQGEYEIEYDVIPCIMFGYKDEQGNYRKSFEYLINNITEGQRIRVQGRIKTWTEGIVEGQKVTIRKENRQFASNLTSRYNVIFSDYILIDKNEKEETIKKNSTNTVVEEQEENEMEDLIEGDVFENGLPQYFPYNIPFN